ncbi:MAG: signal peptide peptidase SppA [Phycisphaerales bacterium]|nr:MAG: signal peptide peptidase SppA [Phycisphaerales bacterium]
MKAWTLSIVAVLGMLLQPVAADEVTPDDKAKAEEQAKEAKPSPIPRLAELRIDEHVVAARMINLPLPSRTKTLQEILDRLDEWSKDDEIGAVLMDVGFVGLSLPDVQELRAAVERLQKNDKKVMAYLQVGGPSAYLLACAADEIATSPAGFVGIPGLGRLFPFMKGHYQMRGLEFEVITAGKYKYPGFVNRREPDKYFIEEFDAVLDSWFDDYKTVIGESRGLSPDAVSTAIDVALFNATQAQQRGLVDTIAYYHEYRERLLRREKMKRHRDKDEGLANVNSLQDIVELINKELKKAEEARKAVGPKIAVLHARGPIVDMSLGATFSSVAICRDAMVEVINDLRKNKSIKAVVMRVDSPGGSGHASDAIWKALRELDEEKPLVVSMGSVAGSGGYYIACPGRRIFAQPTTLTGSIGVIAILGSPRSQLNRMDFELAPFERGARSLLGAPDRDLAKEDRAFVQKFLDDFYAVFIERVAQTRKIPADMVRKIAEGRIWTGRDALDIGLVDELGGLAEAIEAARTLANIPPSAELKIVHYPRPSSLGEIIADFGPVGVTQGVETLLKSGAPARPMAFDEQLALFSRRIAPLCWMAVPNPHGSEWPASGAAHLRLVPDFGADLLPSLLRTAPALDGALP